MGSALYHPGIPGAVRRPLEGARYAVDDLHAKLLHLVSGFRTATGCRLAGVRHDRMVRFLDELANETGTATVSSP